MTSTIRLLLDSDSDDTFTTDLTPWLLHLRWRRGMAERDDTLAAPLTGEAALVASAALPTNIEGLAVRVLHDGQPLLTARVRAVQRPAGRTSAPLRLHLCDALSELENLPVLGVARISERADALAQRLIERLPLRQRWMPGRWQVGVGRLGQVRLPPALAMLIGSGRTRISGWRQELLLPLLAAIAQAEGGVFLCDAQDRLSFVGRRDLIARPPTVTLADAFDVLALRPAPVVNRVAVWAHTLQQGAENSVLWTCEASVRCAGRSTTRLSVRWRSEAGQPVQAAAVRAPQPWADVRFGYQPTLASETLTASIGLSLVGQTPGGAVLEVANPQADDAWLLAGAVIRGTPLLAQPDALTTVEDAASVGRVGLRNRTLRLPMLAGSAHSLALAYLQPHRSPADAQLLLDGRRHPAALSVDVWQRVHLTTTQPPRALTLFVTEQTHEITHRGTRHRLTWELRDASRWRGWLLNTHRLNNAFLTY